MRLKFLLYIILCSYFFKVKANNFTERIQFTAYLEGNQVRPVVTTNASGVASFVLNRSRDSLYINLSCIGLNSTLKAIKIYVGAEGVNGVLIKDVSSGIIGNRLSFALNGTDVKTNLKNLFNDNLYVLVETSDHLSGELRGQIKLETDYNFVTDLKGGNTVPATVTNAFGLGSFSLSHDEKKLDFKIICSKLSGPITKAQLWIGSQGTVGKMDVDISTAISGNVLVGNIMPSHGMLHELFEQNVYLNIVTSANPNGEIRAQLINYKGLTFESWATGDQMYIPTNSQGQAISVMRLSPGLDTLFYDSVSEGLAIVDYAHLHIGKIGEPYGALQVDFTQTISGSRIKGFKRNIGAENINRLLTSNLAFLYHTAKHPDGEIRGQVLRYARNGFTINMDGQQVVPSKANNGYGTGIVSTSRNDDNVHYMWVAGNLSGQAISSHFSNNTLGGNGPILFDLTPDMFSTSNEAEGKGYWTSSDTPSFNLANSNQFSSRKVYLEINTAANPNGEIRGQALGTGKLLITTSTETIPISQLMSVSPNPVNNDLLIELDKNSAIKDIKIYNTMGLLVKAFSIGQSTQVDVSNLPKGMYFLKSDQDHRLSAKFLKQ